MQGVDRAMAIAAQAFSALIPLLIVYSAAVPRRESADFADTLVDRFDLEGAAAASVRDAFAASTEVTDSVNVLGLVLLLVAALSFTRGLQRLYEGAYKLPSLGFRGSRSGLAWLAALVVFLSVRPPLSDIFDATAAQVGVALTLNALLWLMTPYLLLGRRLHWRILLPGTALTAVANTALAASSVIWLPPSIASSAEQYGVMGVAFALLGWLVAASFTLVISTTGGAVAAERIRARWPGSRPPSEGRPARRAP